MTVPRVSDEAGRLAALHSCGVLDTLPEAQYDGIARLAAAICGTPISLVSLVDCDRQWFKARVGMAATETPRASSFCDYSLATPGLTEIPDALQDARFRDNPLVTGGPGIRFYAGVPLTDPDGFALGTLCVIDRVPRELTAVQRDALETLAGQVVVLLQARRRVAELEQAQARLVAEQERFRAFMDNGPAVAFLKDDGGRFAYVNETLTRRFGMPAEAWLGKTDVELWGPEVGGALRRTDLAILQSGETQSITETVPTPDGESFHWHVFKFPFTDAAGQRFLAGMAVDRTAEWRAEEALRASEAKFRAVVDGLAEGVLLIDAESKAILDSNAAACRLFDYTPAELAARTLYDLCTHDPASVDANCGRVRTQGQLSVGRRRYRRNGGALLDLELSASLIDQGGRAVIDIVFRDVGEAVRAEERLRQYQLELEGANEQLRHLAVTDGLTGVRNRAAFDARLAEAYGRAARSRHPLSVILLDVDSFKAFNDAFGHPAGDEALKAVAAAVAGAARATDTVARYGGEEFVVILPDTDYAGAMVLAERCRRAVADARWELRPITVSVGVSTLTPETPDAAALVREADEAMYRSKQAGRNRVNHGSGAFRFQSLARAT